MPSARNHKLSKPALRRAARELRNRIVAPDAGQGLIDHFPNHLTHSVVAGFAPTQSEIDLWPLLYSLYEAGRQIALPVITAPNTPLIFREWTPGCMMAKDQHNIEYPSAGKTLSPTLILLPLLAFTARGERLGYGGGYYDRTLANLRAAHRRSSDLFACGVAYGAQEVGALPTHAHDVPLDGILTPTYFKAFP